jgi:hypothetical protein
MAFEPLAAELLIASQGLVPWASRYALFGSSVMYLYGLREEIGDVDIFVAEPLWHRLEARGWERQTPREEDPPLLEGCLEGMPPVHAFYDWKKRGMQIDIAALLNTDLRVEGWPVQSLESLRDWKASIAHHDTRPNDYDDIEKIDSFLRSGTAA